MSEPTPSAGLVDQLQQLLDALRVQAPATAAAAASPTAPVPELHRGQLVHRRGMWGLVVGVPGDGEAEVVWLGALDRIAAATVEAIG